MMHCMLGGLFALILATALLVWVSEKNGNSAQKAGKFLAWVAILVALASLVGHIAMCGKMCGKGGCPMMGKHGMMMMDNMTPPPPPVPAK